MSHLIDFGGLAEKLFILRHVVHGAHSYCISEQIGGNQNIGRDFSDEYWSELKGLLSNYLIESAVKIRIVQDYCRKENSADELKEIENRAIEGISLGKVIEGSFSLTLREASNKIIHATKTTISLKEFSSNGENFESWDGIYHLHGKFGRECWYVELDVEAWAKSMSIYLTYLSDEDKIFYLGQDWS